MSRATIDDTLRQLFVDLFDLAPEEVRNETSPDDCKAWDSVAHVKLVAAVEETFGFVPAPEDEADMLSFELIADILEERLTGG